MIELKGQGNSSIYVKPGAIARFKDWNYQDESEGAKIDYSGTSLHTPERSMSLAERLDGVIPFVRFTVRAGVSVWVNAAQVSEIGGANSIDGEGAQLRIGGLKQHVVEDPDSVRQLIESATGA